jgi:ankyrin repeat protein
MNPTARRTATPTAVWPELERAAISGDVPALEAQLAAGADVDAKDRFGQTALMLAAHHGRLDAVKALLRHEANPDVTAKHGLSALMLAIVAGHESVAREFALAGADLALRGTGAPGFTGKSAQDLAREHGMAALAEELAP